MPVRKRRKKKACEPVGPVAHDGGPARECVAPTRRTPGACSWRRLAAPRTPTTSRARDATPNRGLSRVSRRTPVALHEWLPKLRPGRPAAGGLDCACGPQRAFHAVRGGRSPTRPFRSAAHRIAVPPAFVRRLPTGAKWIWSVATRSLDFFTLAKKCGRSALFPGDPAGALGRRPELQAGPLEGLPCDMPGCEAAAKCVGFETNRERMRYPDPRPGRGAHRLRGGGGACKPFCKAAPDGQVASKAPQRLLVTFSIRSRLGPVISRAPPWEQPL